MKANLTKTIINYNCFLIKPSKLSKSQNTTTNYTFPILVPNGVNDGN